MCEGVANDYDAGAQPGADDTFGDGGPASWDDYGFGQATVADGVNLIAGGIENVLQRFRLQVPDPTPLARVGHFADNHRSINAAVQCRDGAAGQARVA